MRAPSLHPAGRKVTLEAVVGTSRRPLGALIGTTFLLAAGAFPDDPKQQDLLRAFEGTLYEIGSQREKVLYQWELWASRDGQHRATRFTTPDGRVVASENLILEGRSFRHYTLVHHNANQKGEIRRVGDRLHFSYTRDGETETDSEEYDPRFVAGPMIVTTIQSAWDRIRAGEKLEVRVGVVDRTESVGFVLYQVEESKWNGQDAVRIKMRPSNFFYRALVDPVYFTFSRDGRRVYQVRGRTIPLHREGNEWKPTQVVGIYRPVSKEATEMLERITFGNPAVSSE